MPSNRFTADESARGLFVMENNLLPADSDSVCDGNTRP